jgi:hypothetical protein
MLNGIAVFVMLLMLFMWLGRNWRQRLVGFGFITDLSVHVLCQFLLGGANEGRLAVLFGCVMFNLFLMSYRKLWGWQAFENGEWTLHRGLFTWRNHGTPQTR